MTYQFLFSGKDKKNIISFTICCGWLGGAKVSCIFCHPGRPADIGL